MPMSEELSPLADSFGRLVCPLLPTPSGVVVSTSSQVSSYSSSYFFFFLSPYHWFPVLDR